MNGLGAGGSDPLRLSTRFALGAGFGGLLAIMALAGGLRRILPDSSHRGPDSTRFLLKNHTLNDIRFQFHLAGTYVRDYLLEPDPHLAASTIISLEERARKWTPRSSRSARNWGLTRLRFTTSCLRVFRVTGKCSTPSSNGTRTSAAGTDTLSSGSRSFRAVRRCLTIADRIATSTSSN